MFLGLAVSVVAVVVVVRSHVNSRCFFLSLFFFGFSVITRPHGSFEGRHLVEILPTDLPELSKPIFSKSNRGKNKI